MATAAEAGACFCPLQVRLLQSVLASHWLDLHILTLYEQHPYFPQADKRTVPPDTIKHSAVQCFQLRYFAERDHLAGGPC